MPILEPGRPHRTGSPTLLVENALDAGNYRFELVCADDAGNLSAPAQIIVTVTRPTRIDVGDTGVRLTRREPIPIVRGQINLRRRG